MSLDLILDCSERILVESCSEDISKEKKATVDLDSFFLIFFAAWKAILVAKAVLPIDGLPAIITRSCLCKPPNLESKSVNPVGTPTIPSSFLKALFAISIVCVKAFSNFINDWLKWPLSAKSNKDFSAFWISSSPEELISGSLEASFKTDSEILISSLRTCISWIMFA